MKFLKFSNPVERTARKLLQQIFQEEVYKELANLIGLIKNPTANYNLIDVEKRCLRIVGNFSKKLINGVVKEISKSEKREKNYIIGEKGVKKNSTGKEKKNLKLF